ncbi:hypothetical protein DCAR_0626098 [Daucus carota subsp. sativus]|uniref:Uncharacterized protein n=1 Tax=Daucus carota subsp. sativus TaxID=79200 RepID=A0A164WVI2_DAUCS|nr:hypothetical protein DCAR_0626098 [Daucus carota subsp. sativus]
MISRSNKGASHGAPCVSGQSVSTSGSVGSPTTGSEAIGNTPPVIRLLLQLIIRSNKGASHGAPCVSGQSVSTSGSVGSPTTGSEAIGNTPPVIRLLLQLIM